MKTLSEEAPVFDTREPARLRQALDDYRASVADTVNFNRMEFVSQAGQPTPAEGRVLLWEDTDAGAGNPTHYIVVNFGGTILTFASDQTA